MILLFVTHEARNLFFFSVRGGLTLDEGIYIAQIVAQSGMFVINIMLILEDVGNEVQSS